MAYNKRFLLIFIFLLFCFILFFNSLFVFADLIDEYDYTNGVSITYNISKVDSDSDGLYDYVTIVTNDSRAVVKLNADFGTIFYPASILPNNTLEIAIYSNGQILYDKTFLIYFDMSEFDSFQNELNFSYYFLDLDFDNYTDRIVIDSGVLSNVIFYFDTYSLTGFRYVNITDIEQTLFFDSVYVQNYNHLYDLNYSIFVLNPKKVEGVQSVSEFLSNYTLYLNISFHGQKQVLIKVYDYSGDFLYFDRVIADEDFIYALNSSFFVSRQVNGPYGVYIGNIYYLTKNYNYIELDSDFFQSFNQSANSNTSNLTDSEGSAEMIGTDKNKGAKGGGYTGVIAVSDNESVDVSNMSEVEDDLSVLSHVSTFFINSFIDLFADNKSMKKESNRVLTDKETDKHKVTSTNTSNIITGFFADTKYTYFGIVFGSFVFVSLVIYWFVRKRAGL